MLGELISAGTSLLSGFLGQSAAKKAAARAEARDDTAIQRRVADSVAAGIHPLFGLGASVSSSQPVIAGQVADGLRDAGQDLGRAVSSYQSLSERNLSKQMAALQLRRAGLENTLIEEQIRSARARAVGTAPPFPETLKHARAASASVNVPGQGDVKLSPPGRTTHLKVGRDFQTNPYFTDADSIEQRYGDSELLSMLAAVVNGGADAYWNMPAGPRVGFKQGVGPTPLRRFLARAARKPGQGVGLYLRGRR